MLSSKKTTKMDEHKGKDGRSFLRVLGVVEVSLVLVVWGRGDSKGVWYSLRMDYWSNIYGCEEGEG